MNYKIRFFDILNCILLGATSIGLILFSISLTRETNFAKDILSFLELGTGDVTKINIYAVVIVLAIVYSAGLFINSLVDLFSSFSNRNTILKYLGISTLFLHSINSNCYAIKKKAKRPKFNNSDYPAWVFFSENPYRILSVLIERISQVKDENILNEYRYLNEFFQGMFYVSILCIVIVLSSLFLSEDWQHILAYFNFIELHFKKLSLRDFITLTYETVRTFPFSTSIILFCTASIFLCFLCAGLANFYAKKLIKYISACVEAHKINIDDIIVENGLPTAFILMKVSRAVCRNQLKASLESIKNQDYKNIKIIMFVYGKNKPSGMTDFSFNYLIDSYRNDEFLEFVKYTRESFNKAEAALEVRKIFCDIAREDDVAIFLDPSDELDNKKTVSVIMKKFAITNANLCLLGFTETENTEHSLIRHDKVVYDNLLKYIEGQKGSLPFSSVLQLHAAMTLNCVKAYKKEVLLQFVGLINEFDENNEYYKFKDTGSYASFLDFFVFLVHNVRITAISKSSHKYVQSKDKHKKDNLHSFLDVRTKSLQYMLTLACSLNYLIRNNKLEGCSRKNYLCDNFFDEILKYFKYKLYVIKLLVEHFDFEIGNENSHVHSGTLIFEKQVIFIKKFSEMFSKLAQCKKLPVFDDLKSKSLFNDKSTAFDPINLQLLDECFKDAKSDADRLLKNTKSGRRYRWYMLVKKAFNKL